MNYTAAPSAGGYYTSLTGWTKGDIINFTGASATESATEATLGAKIALGGSANFANYLDAATATTGTQGELNWFQFSSNTYVTMDNSANTSYADGVDVVVELAGLVDLSGATNAVTGVLTLV